MKDESGISEVLSAVFMIAIIVGSIGAIGISYLSQPPPEKIPEVNFIVGITGNTLYLSHDGGDSLKVFDEMGNYNERSSDFYILMNRDDRNWFIDQRDAQGEPEDQHFRLIQNDADDVYFNNGEKIQAQFVDLPQVIQVVYRMKNGGEKIIWTGEIAEGANFLVDDRRACVGVPVQFTDESNNNPNHWEWDFDADGIIDSFEENPQWTYNIVNNNGFTVILKTSTIDGTTSSAIKNNYIIVKHVHADFSEEWDPNICGPGDNSCNDCRREYPGQPCAAEALPVTFSDNSRCNPTEWRWDFGDGTPISIEQNPVHQYEYDYVHYDGTTPIFYTPELVTRNIGGADTRIKQNRIVLLGYTLTADFEYDLLAQDEDENSIVEFTDTSVAYPRPITTWEWIYTDSLGNSATSLGRKPPEREFPPGSHTVTLRVTNEWGRMAEISKPLKFPCPKNTAIFTAEPKSGPSPLNVTFTDLSLQRENITAWRWSFGDGTYYYSTNKTNPNPPPHLYSRAGTFSASLTVENQCGQSFANTSVLVVSKDASIGGKIWLDRDEDGSLDSGERYVSGFNVDLEERKSGLWEVVNTTTSDANGNYLFVLQGVSNSVFRVRQHLPDTSQWRVTKSYGTYKEVVSDNLLIYDTRHYANIDFGNNRLQTSKISLPGSFVLKRTGGQGFYADNYLFRYRERLSAPAQFLDYNTSYDLTPRVVFASANPSPNGSFNPDPPGGYPQGYTSWGDSSFTLKMRKYNTYLKQVSEGAYFLDLWQYNNGTGWVNYYSGDSFFVPDNTTIASNQLQLIYYYHPEDVFDFDKPDEGAIVPYTASYTVEAHMEGINESSSNAWLILPVTKKFSYNSTVGEYLITNIDTRPFEGQTKLFKGQMNLTNSSKMYCYTNATIDWEPNYVSIINITSDITYGVNKTVKGNTTVWASIGGKWQVNNSAKLILNGEDSINMTVMSSGVNSTVKAVFNPEPYSGRTIPIYVTVPHAKGQSYTKNSAIWNMSVLSKLPIEANFTAYPWKGRAPHEVAFTDLSTGGANKWKWNFSDGSPILEGTSIAIHQNPIHYFNNTGNYSVRLTVTNATILESYFEKNISVIGTWHQANLLTNRVTSLTSGGWMSFISRGANSTISINNSSYTINDGSTVEISLNNAHSMGKIFMAGGINECNLTNVTLKIDNNIINTGSINDIRILDFENFHSNLSLTAGRSYSKWISFQWDVRSVPVSYRNNLIVNDLMPTIERFMSLEFNQNQSYFDGIAGDYYFI